MNTINTKRYLVIIIIQYLILLFDIFVNSFTSFSRSNSINLLILYVYVFLLLYCSKKINIFI